MPDEEHGVTIVMVREDLDDLPDTPLPAPYSLRGFQPGDRESWVRIERKSDEFNEITPELFDAQFGAHADELPERQLYLCDGAGRPVGTTTAWLNDDYPDRHWGRVHWVAIVPAHQGRGLAKPLLGACLRRMREMGCDGAYLTTDPPRVTAINLYLGFGFRPDVRSSEEAEAWRGLREKVKPEFRAILSAAAGGEP